MRDNARKAAIVLLVTEMSIETEALEPRRLKVGRQVRRAGSKEIEVGELQAAKLGVGQKTEKGMVAPFAR